MDESGFVLTPIGVVSSPLKELAAAPLQGDEGAPESRIVIRSEMTRAMADLVAGDRLIVLTWLHQARRDVLAVHPRGDATRPETGVFSTRSPDRPNPIGLHDVRIVDVRGNSVIVSGLEAIDGTPVLDIKPVLGGTATR